MDVLLHSRLSAGRIRRFRNVSCDVADRMFAEHTKLLHDPLTTYYRVSLVDPGRGDYIVKDTDKAVHGIGGGAI